MRISNPPGGYCDGMTITGMVMGILLVIRASFTAMGRPLIVRNPATLDGLPLIIIGEFETEAMRADPNWTPVATIIG